MREPQKRKEENDDVSSEALSSLQPIKFECLQLMSMAKGIQETRTVDVGLIYY